MLRLHRHDMPSKPARRDDAAFTLLEVLVVIAVITILLALLLPAVQVTRESARRTQCRNNLKQIALGTLNFESTYRTFPGNGWGFGWVGDPDRGAGKRQPGGWIYQILPQVDAANISQIGSGLPDAERRDALKNLCSTPLPLFKCPSRPVEQSGPPTSDFTYFNADAPESVSRTDYAINEGDYISGTPAGPRNLAQGDDPNFAWTDVSNVTGISWLREGATMASIRDGSSNTYLVGEKYVSTGGYRTADDDGYDQTMYSGVDLDIARWVQETPIQDTVLQSLRSFGSAHPGACFMAMCDGSVRQVSYSIDADVHRWMGNRHDGEVVPAP